MRAVGLSQAETADWLLADAVETEPECARHMDTPCLERPDLSTDTGGYTQVNFQNKKWRAHRLINEAKHGALGNQYSLHHCDNRKCLNPDHLHRGTHQDNLKDMRSRDRQVDTSGARNGKAKLKPRTVILIRILAEQGESNTALARRFGVNQSTVSSIVLRKTWK